MAKEIDVYREWLQITEPARPLNHYQLLRLKGFEDDAGKIRENYRKMNAHVRKYAAGEYSSQSQALLNELAKAMLCLTDSRRKGEYDVTLGRKDTSGGVRRTFEELLLARSIVDPQQLKKARTMADTLGWELRDALMQQKLASELIIPVYAESIGLPYLELADITLDPALLPKVPAVLARQHSCVPVLVDDNQVLIATPNPLLPDVEEELRLRLGMSVRNVLCTPAAMNEAIAKHYPKEAAVAEMQGKSAAPPKASASGTASAAPQRALTPEEKAKQKKDRQMLVLVGFNLAFMATIFAQMMLMNNSIGAKFAIALPVGLIAAGIAFFVGGKKI